MFSAKLQQALSYRRFRADEPSRVLVFDSAYFVIADILDAATDLGWQILTVPTPQSGPASDSFVATLLTALARFRPDFVITVNHLGFDDAGVLAHLLEQYRIPLASWFVDHPLPILGGANKNATANCQVFTFERTSIPWLAAQGYDAPAYLPTASNARYFDRNRVAARDSARFATDVAFVGSSWWQKARIDVAPELRRAAERFLAAHPLPTVLTPELIADLGPFAPPAGRRTVYSLAQLVLAEASLERRRRFATALAPLGICIYGDPHWTQLAPGVRVRSHVDYHDTLPHVLSATRVNPNVTAVQMPTAVNQRVWDVPAVGGFLLTDAQEDALTFFDEGQDIAVYRSFDELHDKCRHYLAHPTEREAIATRGCSRVQQAHRYTHRLEQMWRTMCARFGSS